MTCETCPNSAAWHRRQLEHLESTIGPRAAQDFEQAHPEAEESVDGFDPRHPRAIEHEDGWHAEYVDVDCPTCREESAQLGMTETLPEPQYETRTDQTIRESGVTVDPRDRSVLAQQATRAANMNGGRYSDELRSELRTYEYAGRDGYLKLVDEGNRVARTLGYVR